jgi:hypothetical protein
MQSIIADSEETEEAMTKVIFYCDESGAKGYADQMESEPGEVGVFAGIMVPEDVLQFAKPAFDAIAVRYAPSSGKLHIADLTAQQQQQLREELYAAVREWNLPCFWYAVHVAGFNSHHVEREALTKELREKLAARDNNPPRFKRGSPRSDPPSLHVTLFEGLYSHLVAFLIERDRREVTIEVRTDQVDAPIVERFEEVATELLNDQPLVDQTRAFDTVTKQLVTGALQITVQFPDELKLSPIVNSLSISIAPDSDGLVLAADVLANSLYYHFKSRGAEQLYKPLNRPEAVAAHPLGSHLDAFADWGEGDLIGDALYRHPLSVGT